MKIRQIWIVVLLVFLASCAALPPGEVALATSQLEVSTQASREDSAAGMDGDLDRSDPDGILFMREEEKLARDVYRAMADLWGMSIFSNIAASEQAHMDAVLVLIDAAGEEDPAGLMEDGAFKNPDLQTLYDDLISRGSQSLVQALLVGGAIEEIDILDLQGYLSETIDPDAERVYQNLLKGSINHLRSFVRIYERETGETYQPQFLSADEFEDLFGEEAARGAGRSRGAGIGQGQNRR